MKRYVALFLTVVMVLFLPFRASAAYAVEIPVTASQTSVVIDISTGQVLVEKEMNQKMYPASITKIMTVLLALENADEKREFQNISRQKLCRCRMLVVCGNEISNSMSAEIGTAEKRNIICTTLEGLAKIKESDEHDGL